MRKKGMAMTSPSIKMHSLELARNIPCYTLREGRLVFYYVRFLRREIDISCGYYKQGKECREY